MKGAASPLKESDLYQPVRDYLVHLGYQVKGEVGQCDLVARSPEKDEVLAVELKKSFTLRLLVQGAERQRYCDTVYLAVPVFGSKQLPDMKGKLLLLKRLGLGLLLVRFLKHRIRVEEVCPPGKGTRAGGIRKIKRKREKMLLELDRRSGDYTPGGTRGKVVTAYREEALYLALLLQREGVLSPARCRQLKGTDRAGSILLRNHYRWFERIGRGAYRLSAAGEQALAEYGALVKELERNLPDKSGSV